MNHEVRVLQDGGALAHAGSAFCAQVLADALAARDTATVALSGGTTPWEMLGELATVQLAWSSATAYQVDERVVPRGDAARNLGHLHERLAATGVTIEAMPVEDADLAAAALRYGDRLPSRFDLVHLGLGPDGHCASLVPDDPVLAVLDRPVAVTGIYQGTRRMTLTYPALERADQLLWLVSGADKGEALARLLDGDRTIPAGRVEAARSLVLTDEAAWRATREHHREKEQS